MNPAFETYIQSLTGRDVTVIGVGVSNAPLIRMLCSAEAIVTVRDRNPDLPREEWDNLGVRLHLGENNLDRLGGDIVFRTPGTRPDHPALDSARAGGGGSSTLAGTQFTMMSSTGWYLFVTFVRQGGIT